MLCEDPDPRDARHAHLASPLFDVFLVSVGVLALLQAGPRDPASLCHAWPCLATAALGAARLVWLVIQEQRAGGRRPMP